MFNRNFLFKACPHSQKIVPLLAYFRSFRYRMLSRYRIYIFFFSRVYFPEVFWIIIRKNISDFCRMNRKKKLYV